MNQDNEIAPAVLKHNRESGALDSVVHMGIGIAVYLVAEAMNSAKKESERLTLHQVTEELYELRWGTASRVGKTYWVRTDVTIGVDVVVRAQYCWIDEEILVVLTQDVSDDDTWQVRSVFITMPTLRFRAQIGVGARMGNSSIKHLDFNFSK